MRMLAICALPVVLALYGVCLGCQRKQPGEEGAPVPQLGTAQQPHVAPEEATATEGQTPSEREQPGTPSEEEAAAPQPEREAAKEGLTDEEIGRLGNTVILIRTEKGDIICKLYDDAAPKTCERLKELIREGFFDGLTFHRVEDFCIQGGRGSPPVEQTIPDEHNEYTHVPGALGMAKTLMPDSATSQFYILKKEAPWLDGGYTIWGQTIEGMDVVQPIEAGDRIEKMSIIKEQGAGQPVRRG